MTANNPYRVRSLLTYNARARVCVKGGWVVCVCGGGGGGLVRMRDPNEAPRVDGGVCATLIHKRSTALERSVKIFYWRA